MFKVAPFLWQYWRNSHPAKHAAIARSYSTLIAHCVSEHRALAADAGASALLRPIGWMKVFRSEAKRDAEIRLVEQWHREYGVAFEPLGGRFFIGDANSLRDRWAVDTSARTLFPLRERLDAEPWMGRRPCTPDMMPIIGPAPNHRDLWFAFGHAHHGLTLGPVTGRLIAEMMTNEETVVDARPFRADRF